MLVQPSQMKSCSGNASAFRSGFARAGDRIPNPALADMVLGAFVPDHADGEAFNRKGRFDNGQAVFPADDQATGDKCHQIGCRYDVDRGQE